MLLVTYVCLCWVLASILAVLFTTLLTFEFVLFQVHLLIFSWLISDSDSTYPLCLGCTLIILFPLASDSCKRSLRLEYKTTFTKCNSSLLLVSDEDSTCRLHCWDVFTISADSYARILSEVQKVWRKKKKQPWNSLSTFQIWTVLWVSVKQG